MADAGRCCGGQSDAQQSKDGLETRLASANVKQCGIVLGKKIQPLLRKVEKEGGEGR